MTIWASDCSIKGVPQCLLCFEIDNAFQPTFIACLFHILRPEASGHLNMTNLEIFAMLHLYTDCPISLQSSRRGAITSVDCRCAWAPSPLMPRTAQIINVDATLSTASLTASLRIKCALENSTRNAELVL